MVFNFRFGPKEWIELYQGVKKACCRLATNNMIPVLYQVFLDLNSGFL